MLFRSNVPIGDYRVVIASDYSRLVLDSPADFAKNATQATEIQSSTLPSYIIVDPDIVANGMNALNAVEPTTLNLSIRDNSVYLSDFFLGPAEYTPLQIDSNIVISQDNLITDVDNGTFGTLPQGSLPNSGDRKSVV